ncbi:CC171 protein, partial [Daphoenositta chrysoptera]|nr:CC171 protein [Daphoenositta chrysoptera]
AILQQEVFEFSRRLHTAEVECRSLHLQLAEFKWTFNDMQKDAEKAQALQEQLNALQHVSIYTTYFSFQRIITQDNIHEELENALQREQEARLLLQEHERRLQDLSNRLEVHTTADTDRSQDVSLKSLSEASEELRRRDRVLNHQKRLLKDMDKDRQRLLESLQEAERDLQKAAKDKEFLINHMKAVHATMTKASDRFASSGYTASTSQSFLLLPSLNLETLSEEEMRGRPEARAFQVRV